MAQTIVLGFMTHVALTSAKQQRNEKNQLLQMMHSVKAQTQRFWSHLERKITMMVALNKIR